MKKNRLKEIRESKNISQSELSRRTTVSQQQISNYEKNSNMREDDIRKICKALEVSADYLLGLIDDDNDMKKD
ncbi:MAG: helix-turn-helix transcriptional regulator [Candidatus Izemoplasmatales bacterium]|nr:helix-turn-helix transcriptional regulator [Candidatus Izemoplasmatales bacterium]